MSRVAEQFIPCQQCLTRLRWHHLFNTLGDAESAFSEGRTVECANARSRFDARWLDLIQSCSAFPIRTASGAWNSGEIGRRGRYPALLESANLSNPFFARQRTTTMTGAATDSLRQSNGHRCSLDGMPTVGRLWPSSFWRIARYYGIGKIAAINLAKRRCLLRDECQSAPCDCDVCSTIPIW